MTADAEPHPQPVDAEGGLAELRRWMQFGGTWRVDRRDGATVTVALCRCDGGEQVDQLVSADPDLLDFVSRNAGPARQD